MSLSAALVTFRAAIAAALPALGGRVIDAQPANADAPRPALPHVVLDVTADEGAGYSPHITTIADPAPATTVTQTVYQRRQATIRLTWYGSGGPAALSTLRLAKLRPTVYAILRNGATGGIPIAVDVLSDVLDTSALRSTTWEPAAAQDWAMRYLVSDAVAVDTIETIETPVNEPEGD